MIETYILFRIIAYVSVGIIAYSRKNYPVTVLSGCLVGGALHPEVIPYQLFQEVLSIGFPMVMIWLGWEMMKQPAK